MSRRKRRSAADFSEDSSDDEPITQALSRRNGSRALQESEDVAEEPAPDVEEDAPGPSSRQRASRRQRGASAEIELQDAQVLQEEAEATAKGSKKGKRKEKKAAKKKAAEAEVQGSDGDDSDAAANEDEGHLERTMGFYELEATQATQNDQALISDAEEAKLVRNVMRYLLFHQHQKPGVPVKRQDLTTIIMKSYKGSSRMKKLGTLIIKKAQADFASKFGMELKEISSQVHTRHGQQEGPTMYVLRSLLPASLRNFAKSKPMDLNNAFVMVLAAIITLAGGKLTEDDLELQLEKLGVVVNERHPVLGKPTEQIQTLVQKKLLAESRENGPDGVKKVYAVGDCFLDEVQTDNLANFIEKVFSHAPMTQAAAA